jgi:hypothetical protein
VRPAGRRPDSAIGSTTTAPRRRHNQHASSRLRRRRCRATSAHTERSITAPRRPIARPLSVRRGIWTIDAGRAPIVGGRCARVEPLGRGAERSSTSPPQGGGGTERNYRTTAPNHGRRPRGSRSYRHGRVARAVVRVGRRFRTSPAGGACCVVVGVSGHGHREVPDHVHHHDFRG